MLTYSKAHLAARLGVSKSRVSQMAGDGLPVLANGRVDALAAAGWVLAHLQDAKAGGTREAARVMAAEALSWNVAAAVLHKVPAAVALAASEAGLTRAQAERIANLVLLFLGDDVDDDMRECGMPEMLLPHPTDWPARINWPGLFDEAGAARGSGCTPPAHHEAGKRARVVGDFVGDGARAPSKSQ